MLSAPVESIVKHLRVASGETVHHGDAVVEIDPSPDTRLALINARNELAAAKQCKVLYIQGELNVSTAGRILVRPDSPEGIPTNILAERLKRLESAGIISSAAYQDRPVRYAYTLTKKGTALGDVLGALVRWGKEYIPGTRADGGRS